MFKLFSILTFAISLNLFSSERIVFIHGGPGFNSNPEKNLIADKFEASGLSIAFWNEPSALRKAYPFKKDSAFQNNVDSVIALLADEYLRHGKITVMAHSFGAQIAIKVASERPELIKALVLIAPAMNVDSSDRNIFSAALSDYKLSNPEKASELSTLISALSPNFDLTRINAYIVSVTDPMLFTHYWVDLALMGKYMSYFSNDYQFDIDSFLAIRGTLPSIDLKNIISVPTLAIFGEKDEIVKLSESEEIMKSIFTNLRVEMFSTKHYLHVEESDRLISELELLLK